MCVGVQVLGLGSRLCAHKTCTQPTTTSIHACKTLACTCTNCLFSVCVCVCVCVCYAFHDHMTIHQVAGMCLVMSLFCDIIASPLASTEFSFVCGVCLCVCVFYICSFDLILPSPSPSLFLPLPPSLSLPPSPSPSLPPSPSPSLPPSLSLPLPPQHPLQGTSCLLPKHARAVSTCHPQAAIRVWGPAPTTPRPATTPPLPVSGPTSP